MQADIYDFDKTVLPYDSSVKFWLWSMLHRPWILILLPFQTIWGLLMLTKILPVPVFKKICFCFVTMFDTDKAVKQFWDAHQKDIYPFFRADTRRTDRKTVIISASPDFLIAEIAKRLEVDAYIATPHSSKNGLMTGNLCNKKEKVRRFKEEFADAEVCDVYSDNLKHDRFIFELGKRCFLAKKGVLTEFDPAIAYRD